MLIEKVRKNFDFLFNSGFSFADNDEHADNWSIVLTFGVLLLRFTQDRSDFFVDVGYSFLPDKWYELWDVLALLKNKGELNRRYKASNKVNAVRAALKDSIDKILQVDRYKDQIKTLRAL
jgi:hypothetical protein